MYRSLLATFLIPVAVLATGIPTFAQDPASSVADSASLASVADSVFQATQADTASGAPEAVGDISQEAMSDSTAMVVLGTRDLFEVGPESIIGPEERAASFSEAILAAAKSRRVGSEDLRLVRDERIKAMIATGPAVAFPDLERGAGDIEIPMMLISGDSNMEVPWEPVFRLYEAAPAPKYAIRVRKSDHMTISDQTLSASWVVKPALPGFRFGYDQKAQAYKDYSVAFFDLYLKGDESRATVLDGPSNKFVEIWSER